MTLTQTDLINFADNGIYLEIEVYKNPDLVVDAVDYDKGGPVQAMVRQGTDLQRWRLIAAGNNSYWIASQHDTKLVLSMDVAPTTPNSGLQLQTRLKPLVEGSQEQLWSILLYNDDLIGIAARTTYIPPESGGSTSHPVLHVEAGDKTVFLLRPIEPVKSDLQTLLYQAAQVELSTIPVYLYTMYSIRRDKVTPVNTVVEGQPLSLDAFNVFRSVVVEEMLHLGLVCNLIAATGGTVDLVQAYKDLAIPGNSPGSSYPFPMLHRWPKLTMNLGPATSDRMLALAEIELPTTLEPDQTTGGKPADMYETIGDFYKTVLAKLPEAQFNGQANQLPSDYDATYYAVTDNSTDSGNLIDIRSIDDATKAIGYITNQGEGAGTHELAGAAELSHYYKFRAIYENYSTYLPHASVWPLPQNLNAGQYPADDRGRLLADINWVFCQAFGYALDTLGRIYAAPQDDQLNRLFVGMNLVMTPLAKMLVQQPLNDGSGLNCAPTFEPLDWPSQPVAFGKKLLDLLSRSDSVWQGLVDPDGARRTVTQALHVTLRLIDDMSSASCPADLKAYSDNFKPSGTYSFAQDILPMLTGRDIQAMIKRGLNLAQSDTFKKSANKLKSNMPEGGPSFSVPELKIVDAWAETANGS